jgi:PAS domain S-box-containing protein
MEEAGERSKEELLGELGKYPAQDVAKLLDKLGREVGAGHSETIDVEEHVMSVALTVLEAKARTELTNELTDEMQPRLKDADEHVWLAEADGRIIAVSEAAAAALGYTPEELAGRRSAMLRAAGQDWGPLREQALQDGSGSGLALVRRKDGETQAVHYEMKVVTLAGRRVFLAHSRLVHDYTGDAKRSRERMRLLRLQIADLYVEAAREDVAALRRAISEGGSWTTIAAGGLYACMACHARHLVPALRAVLS